MSSADNFCKHNVGLNLDPNGLKLLDCSSKEIFKQKIVSEYDQEIPQSQTADYNAMNDCQV